MIDSHCHLADEAFADDLDAVIARARTAGLSGALCILSAGDDKESAAAARVRALVAGGPLLASASTRTRRGSLPAGSTTRVRSCGRALLERGRAGHRRDWPRLPLRFLAARRAAGGLSRPRSGWRSISALPVVIHTREATDDTFGILREAGAVAAGRVPLFHRRHRHGAGGARSRLLRLARRHRHAFRARSRCATWPSSSLPTGCSIETDAPYLAPVPHRGKRNEPAFVAHVAETVAALRGIPAADARRRRWRGTSRHC